MQHEDWQNYFLRPVKRRCHLGQEGRIHPQHHHILKHLEKRWPDRKHLKFTNSSSCGKCEEHHFKRENDEYHPLKIQKGALIKNRKTKDKSHLRQTCKGRGGLDLETDQLFPGYRGIEEEHRQRCYLFLEITHSQSPVKPILE